MMVVATAAPVRAHALRRIARRALLGLARPGATSSDGSGDYVIAFSTAPELRSSFQSSQATEGSAVLRNDRMSPLFRAVIEATEEAILNSLFRASTVTSRSGTGEARPVNRVLRIMRRI